MPVDKAPFGKPDRAAKDRIKSCPICGKPAVAEMAPFCSKRCADVDLHRWLGGVYAVPDDTPGQPGPVPTDEDEEQ